MGTISKSAATSNLCPRRGESGSVNEVPPQPDGGKQPTSAALLAAVHFPLREVVCSVRKLLSYRAKGGIARVAESCLSSPDDRQGSIPAAVILISKVGYYGLCCSENTVNNPF